MKKTIENYIFLLIPLILLISANTALAIPYEFNASGALSDQLLLEVTETSNQEILFTFTNTGTLDSIITEIFFDWTPDPNPLVFERFIMGGEVDFTQGTKPNANLSGGNTIMFVADWYTNPINPQPTWGINNYDGTGIQDSLGIVFSGVTNSEVINALRYIRDPSDPTIVDPFLRIGIKVQGIGPNDLSDASVAPIPEPATMLYFVTGLIGLVGSRFRRKK